MNANNIKYNRNTMQLILRHTRRYTLYENGTSRTKKYILDMILVQNVCVIGILLKRNNCSSCCFLNHIICLCKSRVMLRFVRQGKNPVCATFYIHRRNRHESFNNKKLIVTY